MSNHPDPASWPASLEQAERELLLAELQHRVKNLLASVRYIAARTRETSDDLDGYTAHFDGRLGALARVHALLARGGGMSLSLEELIRDELLAAASGVAEARIDIHGPEVQLRPKAAQMLGLAIHELTTNAIKFGALSGDAGLVAIQWRVLPEGLILDWIESGGPKATAAVERNGFGQRLLERGIPYELDGQSRLELTPTGLTCRIELPPNVLFVAQPAPEAEERR